VLGWGRTGLGWPSRLIELIGLIGASELVVSPDIGGSFSSGGRGGLARLRASRRYLLFITRLRLWRDLDVMVNSQVLLLGVVDRRWSGVES
jgi:hypothetical protein